MSSTELRAKYSLGKGSVIRLLNDAGVQRRRRSLGSAEVAELVRLYETGLTIREIAAERGLPKTTVQHAVGGCTCAMAARMRQPG